ncbi:MAG TPA: DUF1572 family protein [Chitinophagaceae bacterium]
MQETFTANCIKRFESYRELGEKTFAQLEDQHFYFKPSPDSNSIAIIIQHMYGNMLSRWTNFLTEDGEKEWRKRDAEFDEIPISREDLMSFWKEGWSVLLNTLQALKPEDLSRTVTIRGEKLLAYDAILRQIAHYSYHVGQIVTLGKMLRDAEFKSLSIPKKRH